MYFPRLQLPSTAGGGGDGPISTVTLEGWLSCWGPTGDQVREGRPAAQMTPGVMCQSGRLNELLKLYVCVPPNPRGRGRRGCYELLDRVEALSPSIHSFSIPLILLQGHWGTRFHRRGSTWTGRQPIPGLTFRDRQPFTPHTI